MQGILVYIDHTEGFGIIRTIRGNYIVDKNQLIRSGNWSNEVFPDKEINVTIE